MDLEAPTGNTARPLRRRRLRSDLLEDLLDPGPEPARRIVVGTAVAIRQLGERVEHRPLAWKATRLLYQTRELKADLPKLVIDDLVGLADEAPTGPESLMGAPRELDVERNDQMLQRRAQGADELPMVRAGNRLPGRPGGGIGDAWDPRPSLPPRGHGEPPPATVRLSSHQVLPRR